jgi:homopolymeric O-antigen transport system ATP-binding protein
MDFLSISGLGKRYLTNRPPSPWQQFAAKFRKGADVAKRPRELWALKDVSFSVKKGTILGVIGPNGAGKTTLLKVLARVTPPTEGRIVGHGSVAPLLELGAGLQPDLTARDNIITYTTWHGVSRAELDRRMDEIVAFAEIEEFLDTPLKRFSSGMYVRLAFSIAVNMQPDILLADEILAVGDLSFQERCLRRVEEAGAAGMTVFFVSHDMGAIQRLCNRVIWLNAGRVVQDGDPATVVSQYEEAAWTLTAGGAKRGKKGDHVNDHGEILSVRLLSSEGREIGAVRHDDEVHIMVTFSMLTPGVTARCVIAMNTRGILAFRTAQPEDIVVREPGIFAVTLRIPANLLADTVYNVKVGILVVHEGRQTTLVQDNALAFRVYAEHTTADRSLLTLYQGSSWAGVVMPRLDWKVTRERDVVITPA